MLTEPCPECRFDPSGHDPAALASEIRRLGGRYAAPLTRGLPDEDLDAVVDARPRPDAWSALELAAHARDVLAVFDDRVRAALDGTRPREPVVDWEGRVEASAACREELAEEIATWATRLADRLDDLGPTDWDRPGLTGRGGEVTVADLAVIALHEGHHHLLDIGRALRGARGR
ncbi:MAG: DinB family protein [Acidimicrobiia bacterium]